MKPADKPRKVVPASARPQPGKSQGGISFTALIFNFAGAIVAGLIVMFLFQHNEPTGPEDIHVNSGYDWMLNSMLENNLNSIEKNPSKLSLCLLHPTMIFGDTLSKGGFVDMHQQYLLKWGTAETVYIDSVRKLTPDTSIVMLPPQSVLLTVGFKSVVDLPWVTYFLYPRRVVYGDSIRDPLYDRANYLVSLNGWGLDKIKTPVEKPTPFMVLPLNK
jgi:hypothetical protein